MIKHIVCFKLNDNTKEECEKAAAVLRSMEGNVPLLKGLEVGVDFLHSPRSYDVILQVTLEDEAALEAYQQDAYHCSVVKKYMHSVAASSVAIDYLID
ncbi:MAG: Dabb family protein [Eubacterium sp.]|nr:Dabb family protein [Eubacterium sp.]